MKQTTKSLVTTLGVLAAAAAIGGAALWVTRDTEKKAEQKEKSAKPFEGLDKAKVRQVKHVRDGKLVAVVTRADATAPWKLAQPVAAEADPSAVDALVNGVADFKQKSELGEADAIGFIVCQSCDLRFFSEVPAATENLYEELQKFDFYYQSEKPEFDFAKSLIGSRDAVLEVGCGAGAFGASITCGSYVGLELTSSSAARARGSCE